MPARSCHRKYAIDTTFSAILLQSWCIFSETQCR